MDKDILTIHYRKLKTWCFSDQPEDSVLQRGARDVEELTIVNAAVER